MALCAGGCCEPVGEWAWLLVEWSFTFGGGWMRDGEKQQTGRGQCKGPSEAHAPKPAGVVTRMGVAVGGMDFPLRVREVCAAAAEQAGGGQCEGRARSTDDATTCVGRHERTPRRRGATRSSEEQSCSKPAARRVSHAATRSRRQGQGEGRSWRYAPAGVVNPWARLLVKWAVCRVPRRRCRQELAPRSAWFTVLFLNLFWPSLCGTPALAAPSRFAFFVLVIGHLAMHLARSI